MAEDRNLPVDAAFTILLDRRLRDDISAGLMVQFTALAALIAHLHRRGSVDGHAIADELTATLDVPEIRAQMPKAMGLAEDLAAQIRNALPDDL